MIAATSAADRPTCYCSTAYFVAAEIVDDDDIAGPQRRYQHLLDVNKEAVAVDRAVDDTGCVDAVGAQGGEEGQRAPAAMRGLGDQSPAARATPVRACHVGLGPGLVDEHQAGRVKPALVALPLRSPSGDVGSVLLAGVQAFF